MSKAAKLSTTPKPKAERLAGIHKGNPFFPYVDSILKNLVRPTLLNLIRDSKEPVTTKKQIYKLYVVNTGHKPSEALFNQWLKYLQFEVVKKLQLPGSDGSISGNKTPTPTPVPRPVSPSVKQVPFLTPMEEAPAEEEGWDNMKARPQVVPGQSDMELRDLLREQE